jgi:catechol 2,3-dioxygenase-like lactoylglutathione lyase family enzyme
MSVTLNHTIVWCRDKNASARYRIEAGAQDYWADPALSAKGEVNHDDGGRGVYFQDLDGHLLEIITRPYGSGDAPS